jgi:hypothetical protein
MANNGKERTRANGKVYVTVNRDVGTITFDLKRPMTVPVVFHVGRVAAVHHENAEYHGWVQRIRDKAAGQKADSAYALIRGVVEHYESGSTDWDMRPTRGPGMADMLVAALVALKGKPESVVTAYVEGKSAAAQRKLAAMPDVAAKIAELFGTADDIDLDSELDDFEAQTQPGGDDDALGVAGEAEVLDAMADEAGLE